MAGSKIIGCLALAALLASAAGGAARAQTDKPPVVARAEQCLRSKVDRVVADEPDIAAAANFLVGYACAEEVAGATRYLRNETYVQLFTSIAKLAGSKSKPAAQSQDKDKSQDKSAAGNSTAQTAAAAAAAAGAVMAMMKLDPETGDIHMTLPGAQAAQANGLLSETSSVLNQFMPDNIPVPIRKLAGDLVLQARERRGAK